jgi:hypothetical protein
MRCPRCHKIFPTCSQLVAHCESGSKKCTIRYADDFGTFLYKLTGGIISVEEKTRPDHLHNPAALVHNPEKGRIERYQPPTAKYLKYSVSKPQGWEEKPKTYTIGGFQQQNYNYLN